MEYHTGPAAATEPVRLSGWDVREQTFPGVRLGGLNSEHVYPFMRKAADEIDRLADENASLREQARQLKPGPEGNGLPSAEIQGVQVLTRAQQTANQVVTGAQQHAQQIVADARVQRDRILRDAREQAARMHADMTAQATRDAAKIAAEAPLEVQRQTAYYTSLAQSMRASLRGMIGGISAQLDEWEAEQDGNRTLIPPVQGGPPWGPTPPPAVTAGDR